MPTPQLTLNGTVATLTLCRPNHANRLELDDLAALHRHIDALHKHTEARVLVLRGEGRHFCSGFHIDAVPGVDAPALFESLCNAWERLPQVTLAVLHGGVWGGATDLALACDFRLGSQATQMAIPAARLGLHYYESGMRRLISRLGVAPAKRLLLAGKTLDAQGMLAAHFLDELHPDDTVLQAAVEQWQSTFSQLAPLALQGMKRHLNALCRGEWDAAAYAKDAAQCANSLDLLEGVAAWQAGRTPNFKGH
jgi:enoyl-CoA hydratase